MALLPLLRRAFADFQAPERRAMGEKVKRLRHAATPLTPARRQPARSTEERADRVLPVLAQILGVTYDDTNH